MGTTQGKWVLRIIFGVIGLVIGLMLDDPAIAIVLAALGVMACFILELTAYTRHLANEIKLLKQSGRQPEKAAADIQDAPQQYAEAAVPDRSSKKYDPTFSATPPPIPKTQHRAQPEPSTAPQATAPGVVENIADKVKSFFTQGNVVVKVGVIIFFIGVGFLLKYAAENSLLPIELRLAGAAACGMALAGTGFFLRNRREAYATVLQGAGTGVMYITVFAAARLYPLLPISLAFFIMVGIVVFSGVLAILQNAKSLAVFGIIGGFLSPILMSTGKGSHVALFSYYSLLNLGIFGTAWFKSWRILNWIGFVFTFFIGSLWGYQYYKPQYFSTTEPFLILHFLFYATISILFAFRQPARLKGYIDGTLVFGLPVVVFALQSALVKDMPFGMAFSALGAGAFYILVCFALWRQTIEGMRLLCESFLSLGVVFISLAIPFAFDSGWTSGIWALEGAGILWVGLRQGRAAPRYFGLLLQAAAALSFLETINSPVKDLPIANAVWMSCAAISIAAFLSSFFLNRFGRDALTESEKKLHLALAVWGFFWWFGGGLNEVDRFVADAYAHSFILLFIAGSCMIFSILRRRLEWKAIEFPVFLLPGVVFITTVFLLLTGQIPHPSADFGWIAFILVLMIQYHILFYHEKLWTKRISGYLHRLSLYLIMLLVSWEAAWALDQIAPADSAWSLFAWGVVPSLFILLLSRIGHRIAWPIKAFDADYRLEGLVPPAFTLGLWMIAMVFDPVDALPLPYLPVASPGDLAQVFAILVAIKWAITLKAPRVKDEGLTRRMVLYTCAVLLFLWMNAVVARCVHYWLATPYTLDHMLESVHFQAGISILWTSAALGTMVFAHKKAWRNIWFAGAVLLSMAVLKLFLIDLVEINTIARIVSFLAVGTLMLIIGYFSPLPPVKKESSH